MSFTPYRVRDVSAKMNHTGKLSATTLALIVCNWGPAWADGPTALQLQSQLAAGSTSSILLSSLGGLARGTAASPGDPLTYNTVTIGQTVYSLPTALALMVQANGGDASNTVINATGETGNRTAGARVADVFNIADHGARGDAATDNAALLKAIAYASTHSGTHILIPTGVWNFSVSSLYGFQFSSNTMIEGADASSTTIKWNDTDGYYLFTATSNVNGAARTQNIAFRNFTVTGTWGTATGKLTAWQLGNNAIIPGGVDGLVIENVTSINSRGFGLGVRGSTNVSIRNNNIVYAYSDGINASECSNLSIHGNSITHTDDDGISAHSDIYDTWTVRRNVEITGNTMFDTQGIDILGARHVLVSGNNIDTVRQAGIEIATVPANTGIEGNSATDSVIVTNNKITNILNRQNIDNQNQGATGIFVSGLSSRNGNYAAIPGEADTSRGKVIDPYPEFMANSVSSSVPVAAGARILISNNLVARTLPASNGSDPRFANWLSFNQGTITSRLGPQNPNLAESDLQGPGIYLSGGDLRDVLMSGNIISGMSYGLAIDGSGHMADLVFRGNSVEDATSGGVLLNVSGTAELYADANFLNLDPYQKSSGRGANGVWNGNGPIAFLRIAGGNVIARNNTILNAMEDTNVDPTDPKSGWFFDSNIDEANPVVVDSFSTANKGMGLIHTTGFRLVQLDSDPASATYDTILSVPVTASAVMPTSGFWIPGEKVTNTAISASQPYSEWVRTTVGTSSVLGVDWVGVPAILNGSLTTGNLTISSGGKIGLDSSSSFWVQELSGKVIIGTGSTRIFSIDGSGNVVSKGSMTASGTP